MKINKRQLQSLIMREVRRITEQANPLAGPTVMVARNESISRSLQAGQVTLINHSIRMSDMRSLMEGFMLNEADVTYTVSKGDVLSRITKRFYGKTDRATYTALADLNDISDPNKIEIGQEIRIPGTLTVNGVDIEASGGTSARSQSRATGDVRRADTALPARSEQDTEREQPERSDPDEAGETSSDESEAEEEARDEWARSEDWNEDQIRRLARSNITDWWQQGHPGGWFGVGERLALEVEAADFDEPHDSELLEAYVKGVIRLLKRAERDGGHFAMLQALRRFSSGFLDMSTDEMTGLEVSTLIARRLTQLNSGLTIRDTRHIFAMLEDVGLAVDYDYED